MQENKQCFLLSFSPGEEAHVSIDLRQDTIEAIPYPGQAIGMKETFLYGGGVKIDMGWCDKFAKGFACASTSILSYYLSQY